MVRNRKCSLLHGRHARFPVPCHHLPTSLLSPLPECPRRPRLEQNPPEILHRILRRPPDLALEASVRDNVSARVL
jgi:hypothetical protein